MYIKNMTKDTERIRMLNHNDTQNHANELSVSCFRRFDFFLDTAAYDIFLKVLVEARQLFRFRLHSIIFSRITIFTFKWLFIFTPVILNISCINGVQPSDSTGQEINTFDDLTASMTIYKYFSPEGLQLTLCVAYINYDRPIKNGGIAINNANLPFNTLYKHYRSTSIALNQDSVCSFVISISTGEKCTSTVTMPSEFGTVTLPDIFKISATNTITWSVIVPGDTVGIRISSPTGSNIYGPVSILDSGKYDINVNKKYIGSSLPTNAILCISRMKKGIASAKMASNLSPLCPDISGGIAYEAPIVIAE
jgi:hypothetical protein